MLRLRLEYLPLGSVQGTQLLGEIRLTNDGTGTMELGNYAIVFDSHDGTTRQVHLEDFPRKNGAWALVWEALTALEAR